MEHSASLWGQCTAFSSLLFVARRVSAVVTPFYVAIHPQRKTTVVLNSVCKSDYMLRKFST